MRAKKLTALALATIMGISSITIPTKAVKAEETPQEYVVVAKNDIGYEEVEETYNDEISLESVESEVLKENNIAVLELTETEAENLEENKNILLVEEDILFEACEAKQKIDEVKIKLALKEAREEQELDVDTKQQWNIDAIHANEQEYSEVAGHVKVAVMDTGVTATDDIEVVGRINLIEGEEEVHPLYEDISGHGTAVASIIAAKENDTGITGVNPNVELYSVKVLDDNKQATLSRVIEGIYWCIENDIDIINMSFGTSAKSEILEQVIEEADNAGILMIAAAGNHGYEQGESTVEYPAAFEEVLAVGATTPDGVVSELSSVGEEIELVAPGEDVPATGYYGEIISTAGTSMAAPHVTGAASVLWAKDMTKSSDFIRELLHASAIKTSDMDKMGSGMVDLDYALSVYDEFAANYVEKSKAAVCVVEENPAEMEVYTEAQVEACWASDKHADAVGLYKDLSASEMEVIKLGAKIVDKRESVFTEGKDETGAFHGFNNYVANYIYVMRMAEICVSDGMKAAVKTAIYPASDAKGLIGHEQIYDAMKTFTTLTDNEKSYRSELQKAGFSNTKKNQACLLVGIATHIAMDAYAHRTRIKDENGNWVKIVHPDYNDGKNLRDDTEHVRNRWRCAKDAAYDIVDVWKYRSYMDADAMEFYQANHNKNKFLLVNLQPFVVASDMETYNYDPTWFIEHNITINN